jgi:hypothetical protein
LRELVNEAETEIRLFIGVRSNFMTTLAHLKMTWGQLGQAAILRVIAEALKVGKPAPAGLTPLEALKYYLSDLKQTHANLQGAGAEVTARLHETVEELIAALDGATGIIAMRLATLETFRQAHLLSSWDQLRARLDETVEDEIRDAFTEETVKRVAEILLKHGLDAGDVFVPGVKLIVKLVLGGFRVGEEVTLLAPHRPGRAQLRHPVLHHAESLTAWRSDGQSEAAVTGIV